MPATTPSSAANASRQRREQAASWLAGNGSRAADGSGESLYTLTLCRGEPLPWLLRSLWCRWWLARLLVNDVKRISPPWRTWVYFIEGTSEGSTGHTHWFESNKIAGRCFSKPWREKRSERQGGRERCAGSERCLQLCWGDQLGSRSICSAEKDKRKRGGGGFPPSPKPACLVLSCI